MPEKLSIYSGEPLRLALEGVANRSQRVNAICDRYLFLTRTALPCLSVAEWSLIFDALNGTSSEPVELAVRALAHGISDALEDGLSAKWGVDGKALVQKIEACSTTAKLAIIEAAERWWRSIDLGNPSDIQAWLKDNLPPRALAAPVGGST